MLKTVLCVAMIGHLLCGICDCLLSYSPSGRLDLAGGLKDANKMREVFRDLPLSWPMVSILLGVAAITMFGFGYLALSRWMAQFSETASVILYISSVVFLVPIVVHHVICGLVEWLYIRLGRTDTAREAALEFQAKTIATMIVGYLGLAVFLITLFVMVVSGKNQPAAMGLHLQHPAADAPADAHKAPRQREYRRFGDVFGIAGSHLIELCPAVFL